MYTPPYSTEQLGGFQDYIRGAIGQGSVLYLSVGWLPKGPEGQ